MLKLTFTITSFRTCAIILCSTLLFTACTPEGFINRVKYKGVKYENTCESLMPEVKKLVQGNLSAAKLQISEYDNTEFDYYYLEPGQFEVISDTLMFRLEEDLSYPKLLDKGVAVHINLQAKPADRMTGLSQAAKSDLGTLVVDREYYIRNRKPFFIYKFPLEGKSIAGKQLYLSFAVAKYKKNGSLKKYFCGTDTLPIGTAMPACCNGVPWESKGLLSAVNFPKVPVKEERFKHASFKSYIDIPFEESSYDYSDSLLSLAIQNYILQVKKESYNPTQIDIRGYASPGGVEKSNNLLSQKRAEVIFEGLKLMNPELVPEMKYAGKGEDWVRVEELSQRSSVLTTEQKNEVLAIVHQDTDNDKKEADLRKVTFWEALVEDVLIKARHTWTDFDFAYKGDLPTLKPWDTPMLLSAPDVNKIIKKVFIAKPWKEGANAQDLNNLNEILRAKASPNLYAMRSAYKLSSKDYQGAIDDLNKAAELDKGNDIYAEAIQGYKLQFADAATLEERKALLKHFEDACKANPSDRALFFNRAIMMDKLGLLEGALEEYEKLFEGYEPTADQLNNRGVARLKANMISGAEADFQAAAAKAPEMAAPHFNLGCIYAWKGLSTRCIDELKAAIRLDSSAKDRIKNNPIFAVMAKDARFEALMD